MDKLCSEKYVEMEGKNVSWIIVRRTFATVCMCVLK